MSDVPWLKFYPRDWRGDQSLRAVSMAARGMWIECLCIMHEARPYGHLILAGVPVGNDVLARMVGASLDEVAAWLGELEKAGVFSRNGKGVIYSRRMTKDFQRSKSGQKSATKRWAQPTEPKGEKQRPNGVPNGLPNGDPITQKPEARSQNVHITSTLPCAAAPARQMDGEIRVGEKVTFPYEGSIEYAKGPWSSIVRASGKNMDPDRVADAFRGYCRKEGISFGRDDIVRVFTTFCEKHRAQ